MSSIVRVESSGNPFAIGVVGARLQRQPSNIEEAVQTVQQLEQSGFNYSIGLSQVNRIHFKRLGWHGDIKKGFEVCGNLQAGADIYSKCKQGADRSLLGSSSEVVIRAALSCYNTGNYFSGERTGYVAKVLSGIDKKYSPSTMPSFRSMFD